MERGADPPAPREAPPNALPAPPFDDVDIDDDDVGMLVERYEGRDAEGCVWG